MINVCRVLPCIITVQVRRENCKDRITLIFFSMYTHVNATFDRFNPFLYHSKQFDDYSPMVTLVSNLSLEVNTRYGNEYYRNWNGISVIHSESWEEGLNTD